MAHPAQRRDDKVTVSRSSPRGRARGCDPNGSLQRGSRKRERSPGSTLGLRYLLHTRARRKIGTRSEGAREKEGKTAGRSEVDAECVYSIASFSQLSLSISFLLAPPFHFFSNKRSLIYPLNEVKRFSH